MILFIFIMIRNRQTIRSLKNKVKNQNTNISIQILKFKPIIKSWKRESIEDISRTDKAQLVDELQKI